MILASMINKRPCQELQDPSWSTRFAKESSHLYCYFLSSDDMILASMINKTHIQLKYLMRRRFLAFVLFLLSFSTLLRSLLDKHKNKQDTWSVSAPFFFRDSVLDTRGRTTMHLWKKGIVEGFASWSYQLIKIGMVWYRHNFFDRFLAWMGLQQYFAVFSAAHAHIIGGEISGVGVMCVCKRMYGFFYRHLPLPGQNKEHKFGRILARNRIFRQFFHCIYLLLQEGEERELHYLLLALHPPVHVPPVSIQQICLSVQQTRSHASHGPCISRKSREIYPPCSPCP